MEFVAEATGNGMQDPFGLGNNFGTYAVSGKQYQPEIHDATTFR